MLKDSQTGQMPDRASEDVAAADLVRQFSYFRDQATKVPVFVSTYGRRTHVLMSIGDFEALGSSPPTHGGNEDSVADNRLLIMLADWIDDGLIICDDALSVLSINRVAQAQTRKSATEVVGKDLISAFPVVSGTLIEGYARRTVQGHTANSADIPSPFRPDRWLRFQTFPLNGCTVIKMCDITEEMQAHRLANMKQAVINAIDMHGTISYVRVSPRGTIDRTKGPFEAEIGLPADRLIGHALADLIDVPLRREFREAMETVLRDLETVKVRTKFLSNLGGTIPTLATIVPLVGDYGCEGAISLMTRETGESAGRDA